MIPQTKLKNIITSAEGDNQLLLHATRGSSTDLGIVTIRFSTDKTTQTAKIIYLPSSTSSKIDTNIPIKPSNALSKKYKINDLSSNEWNIYKPLIVTIEEHGKEDFIACFYDADVYGYGDSIPEALNDLKERLINQLEFLLVEEKQVILGPIPQKQLGTLRHHIKKGT